MTESTYQVEGKPLSRAAQYQQKLKLGVFFSPSNPSLGVSTNASDTAALLASSSDLTVKPTYEREVGREASIAAVSVRSISAQKGKKGDEGEVSYKVRYGVPQYDQGSIYKVASQKSGSTMTQRTNPAMDQRLGLATKSAAASLNVQKLNSKATEKSSKSLHSRFNPELDYRSGIQRTLPAEYLNQKEEDLAANSAAALLKHGGSATERASAVDRLNAFKAKDVLYPQLLAAANDKAQGRLKTISSISPVDMRLQVKLYASALAEAQRRSNVRTKNRELGMVDLGGGLLIPQNELDKKASLIVDPILDDLNTRALSLRDHDQVLTAKAEELALLHAKAKEEETAKRQQEKEKFEEDKREKEREDEQRRNEEDAKFEDYKKDKEGVLQNTLNELKELENKYAEERVNLLSQRDENNQRIENEENELRESYRKELVDMQAEKDDQLKPTLDELQAEQMKLKELQEKRDKAQAEHDKKKQLNDEYKVKLEELENNLKNTRDDIEYYKVEFEKASEDHATLRRQTDELKQKLKEEYNTSDKSHRDLDASLRKLETDKENQTKDLSRKENEIKEKTDRRIQNEHEYNNELPQHLRHEVPEKKYKDVGNLFDDVEPLKHETAKVSKPSANETTKPVELRRDTESAKVGKLVSQEKKAKPPTAESPKKQSGFRRLTKLFVNETSQEKPWKKEKETSPVQKKSSPPKTNESEFSGEIDDILVDKDEQRGLFKEEI